MLQLVWRERVQVNQLHNVTLYRCSSANKAALTVRNIFAPCPVPATSKRGGGAAAAAAAHRRRRRQVAVDEREGAMFGMFRRSVP